MSINLKKFTPRPGLINKQGRLPDPSELVCVEIPKIFDQCLIKRCLVYGEGPDTDTTDCELRSNSLINPRRYIGSRDFNIKLLSADETPISGSPGFKRVEISYVICFWADYIDANGVNRSELYEITRTDTIGKFYSPDPIAQISASFLPVHGAADLDSNIIKLEMVADALAGEIIEENGVFVLDITLGYYIVVKAELIVQLLIPAYDYCPVPSAPCEEESPENVCETFENAPVPKFYPDQNLDPLFSDSDGSSEE